MNITVSPLPRHAPNSAQVFPGQVRQLLDQALCGEGFIQWIELPTEADLDRHAIEITNQRLRRYLQWMIAGPILTILHVTPAQARQLQGINDAYLAIGTSTGPDCASTLSLLDSQLLPAWPHATARPLSLQAHGLSPAQISQRLADANPENPHGPALLLCDTPPRHDAGLWLFDPRDNLYALRNVAQPRSLPHGLVHRWQGRVGPTSRPPLPAPTDFEKGLQLCSHLAHVLREPTCA
ncbi:hypothetical protein RTH46_11015 [Pseudomonas sp. zfem004]|uniref:hypothetical protein n=1 Tax=Pseudomonas sp. zfem004 TaxID=3078199 RepID=UPI00292A36A1|nr:hypothetical protein [Pseudomonas sp. zfem004]MDU9403018.1 hypothetical protein [Pseudomonas sp. zfem004]